MKRARTPLTIDALPSNMLPGSAASSTINGPSQELPSTPKNTIYYMKGKRTTAKIKNKNIQQRDYGGAHPVYCCFNSCCFRPGGEAFDAPGTPWNMASPLTLIGTQRGRNWN